MMLVYMKVSVDGVTLVIDAPARSIVIGREPVHHYADEQRGFRYDS